MWPVNSLETNMITRETRGWEMTRQLWQCLWAVCFLAISATQAEAQTLELNYPDEISEQGAVHVAAKHSLYLHTYAVDRGTSSLLESRAQRALVADEWTTHKQTLSVSFVITAFAWRNGGDEIFLAGLKRDGSTIIERWRFEVPDGAREVRYPGAPPAIGTPQPAYVPALGMHGNTTSLIPTNWRQPITPTRVVLWESSAGPITAMAADPEGRYLLIWNHSAKLLQRLPLVEDPVANPISATTLYSATSHPLLDKVGDIEVRDFGTEGRKFLLRRNTSQVGTITTERYTVIADTNNDGNFESISFFTPQEMDASPYGTWESWKLFWMIP
jgi:hypothetical protein